MQIHSKRRKRSNSARKRKHMELRAIASFACKVRVQDLGTRMKRAWSNERRHRSFSLVYVSPKWNFYKLKSFSQNSLYFTSFVRSGRITGPVSIFIMGHFVAICAIRAWRTAFLIPGAWVLRFLILEIRKASFINATWPIMALSSLILGFSERVFALRWSWIFNECHSILPYAVQTEGL